MYTHRGDHDMKTQDSGNGKKGHGGFTLVEMLVVVAIIGILISMVVPAVGTAMDRAKRTSCQSRSHELARGLMMYSNAHRGRLPVHQKGGNAYKDSWIGASRRYWDPVRPGKDSSGREWKDYPSELLHCPGMKDRRTEWDESQYAITRNISGRERDPSKARTGDLLDDVRHPMETAMIVGCNTLVVISSSDFASDNKEIDFPHSGASHIGTVGYCDGHADWIRYDDEELRKAKSRFWDWNE